MKTFKTFLNEGILANLDKKAVDWIDKGGYFHVHDHNNNHVATYKDDRAPAIKHAVELSKNGKLSYLHLNYKRSGATWKYENGHATEINPNDQYHGPDYPTLKEMKLPYDGPPPFEPSDLDHYSKWKKEKEDRKKEEKRQANIDYKEIKKRKIKNVT